MAELILTTFDWVPEFPRGYVRDVRIRWALEEAALPYRVETVPFQDRNAAHFQHQPFGQVPWLKDGELSVFESGAILLHLGEQSEALMSREPRYRSETIQWLFAGLNSVEMAVLPWFIVRFSGERQDTPGSMALNQFLEARLSHMETVLTSREWLAGRFSIADIVMSDALRLVGRFDALADYPACQAYMERATTRAAFQKAYADQLAHFAAAD
ncbi:glutathione S-transferase family protein [Photobacterium sp. 1_MG-2023]|uniref:glutathione S-transferase family protein n=1 Tax=Photobacterium sp. 1_MG-2023 TaxID=3062646 RepID=UPI0026E2F0CC|nr:glutathione S-transferase family protein [Photobacterium sp. 1_MG-2023]MDO6705134.1 glutathione S-transferase family protein [Photobacterium sp. 1_MG-2023]